MKISIITCYDQNDYIRARTLRNALKAMPDLETIVIRNEHKGLLRYFEVSMKIIKSRWHDKPDAYIITFRGYEMLLFMVCSLVRKPIIFDELINFTEWMEEHGRFKAGSLAYRLFQWWYGRLARHSRFILADTEAHAHYSANLNKLPLERYCTIPVGAEETLFFPQLDKKPTQTGTFSVFYYGNMLPLHGLSYVLDAAILLRNESAISFRIVGGKDKTELACAAAKQAGAQVTHEKWIPFAELPHAAHQADLTLGGPFGNTLQSHFVITGKTYQFLALAAPILIGVTDVQTDFVDHVNCLVVPQANAEAIASAITWAYQHPEELQKIGLAGRQLYEQQFSQHVINDKVSSLIKDLTLT